MNAAPGEDALDEWGVVDEDALWVGEVLPIECVDSEGLGDDGDSELVLRTGASFSSFSLRLTTRTFWIQEWM